MSAQPCTIGTTNLFQQWKVTDFTCSGCSGHGLQPMAHTGDICLEYEIGTNNLVTWDCNGQSNQKWFYKLNVNSSSSSSSSSIVSESSPGLRVLLGS